MMSPSQPADGNASDRAPDANPGHGGGGASAGAVFTRVMTMAIVGVIGAAVSALAIGATSEFFRLPPELVALGVGGIPGPADQAKIVAGGQVLAYKHAALWLGMTGAILGGLFCLAAVFVRGRATPRITEIVPGIACGGIVGLLAGLMVISIERQLHASIPSGSLSVPEHLVIGMHAALWFVMGAGIGLGVGIGTSGLQITGTPHFLLLTAIAAMLGGVLYPILSAFILPSADISLPIPLGISARILWLGLPSLLMGLTLGRKV